MPIAIRCSSLVKTYPGKPPVEAVRGIDLSVEQGECFGILGPNGAGKTTTVEILEGLLEPTSGEVEILGMQWKKNADAIRQRVGVSLQETQLSERLSVLETLTMFRSFYHRGISPQTAIARVSLQEKSQAWVKKLSGGQRQRLAVATALVGDPELMFLDEPTTGLDPRSRREIWDLIGDCKRQSRTVLLTTHYMEEAERLCDRVAIVDQGRVISLGTPRELIAGLGMEHIVEFSLEDEPGRRASADSWRELDDVIDCRQDNNHFQLSVRHPHVVIPVLMQRLQAERWRLASLTTRHASLEDVFVKVAGRTIEEAEGAAHESA